MNRLYLMVVVAVRGVNDSIVDVGINSFTD